MSDEPSEERVDSSLFLPVPSSLEVFIRHAIPRRIADEHREEEEGMGKNCRSARLARARWTKPNRHSVTYYLLLVESVSNACWQRYVVEQGSPVDTGPRI